MSVALDIVLLEFPHSQPRALQQRTRLVGVDVDMLARGNGGPNDAERRPVSGSGERSRVAMRQDGLAVRHQNCAVAADGLADGDVFPLDLLCFGDQRLADCCERLGPDFGELALHAVDRPEEVDGGGTRRGQGPADLLELGVEMRLVRLQDT